MKNKPIKIYLLLFLFISSLWYTSCETRKELVIQDDPVKIQEMGGLSIALEFLSRETLEDMFGPPKKNPFITVKYAVLYFRIVVFKIIISNQTAQECRINLSDIEIHFEGNNRRPTNKFLLKQYWKGMDMSQKIDPRDAFTKMSKIDKNMAKDRIFIKPNGSYRKLIVFKSSFPSYGTAKIYIPVLDKGTQKLIYRFEFEYKF